MNRQLIFPLCAAVLCLAALCGEDFPTVLNLDYYGENATPAQSDVSFRTWTASESCLVLA